MSSIGAALARRGAGRGMAGGGWLRRVAFVGLLWVAVAGVGAVAPVAVAESGPVRVETYAGSVDGGRDGARLEASFHFITGMQCDTRGRVWVSEGFFGDGSAAVRGGDRIRIIDVDGSVRTFAGSDEAGLVEGPARQARFRAPHRVVFDRAGNVFVPDRLNHRIRRIDTAGNVTTWAGSEPGYEDGKGTNAMFYMPISLAIDAKDNLYVADFGNACVRKISPDGLVSTLSGGMVGSRDGPMEVATFHSPNDVAVAEDGTLFVSDWANGRIRRIRDGMVTTISSGLPYNHTVTMAPDGDLLVVCGNDPGLGGFLCKMSPDGERRWTYKPARGERDGPVAVAEFGTYLYECAVLPDGSLLLADARNFKIRRLVLGELLTAHVAGGGATVIAGGEQNGRVGAGSGSPIATATATEGSDGATVTAVIEPPGPRFEWVHHLPGGVIRMALRGQPKWEYRLEASRDMLYWEPVKVVQTGVDGSVVIELTDLYSPCFFRAVEPE